MLYQSASKKHVHCGCMCYSVLQCDAACRSYRSAATSMLFCLLPLIFIPVYVFLNTNTHVHICARIFACTITNLLQWQFFCSHVCKIKCWNWNLDVQTHIHSFFQICAHAHENLPCIHLHMYTHIHEYKHIKTWSNANASANPICSIIASNILDNTCSPRENVRDGQWGTRGEEGKNHWERGIVRGGWGRGLKIYCMSNRALREDEFVRQNTF